MIMGCFMEGLHLDVNHVRPNDLLLFVHLLNQNKHYVANLHMMLEQYEIPTEASVAYAQFSTIKEILAQMDVPTIYDIKSGQKSVSNIKPEDIATIRSELKAFRTNILQQLEDALPCRLSFYHLRSMNASAPRLLVISNYSGAPNPIRPEAEIVLGLVQLGYKVWVMTPGRSAYIEKLEAAGCTIVDHRPQSKMDRKSIQHIRKLVDQEGIQLIQAFYSKAIANAAWAVWNKPTVKLLSYRGYTGNIHWYDPTLYLSFLNPRIDKMVCLAESVRQRYIQNGVKPERAVTIYKGHSSAWYDHIEPADLSEFNLSKDAMICSFVANHRTKMKGVRYLLEAMGELPREKQVHILMIGDGLDTPEVRGWMAEQGVEKQFTFTGFRRDASSLVKACDVSISLSLFGEATQKAMIEAMYLGNPVIMSDIIGNKGMLINGEGGYLVPPANAKAVTEALAALHDNPERRKQMGETSRKHIAAFLNVEKSIAAYDRLYQSLLD